MYQLVPSRERELLWLLALTQFTVIMDFMVMMPLGPQIMHAFSIGPASFAAAVSAYSWCAGISGLLAATYIDRFDRRRLLLVVYAIFAVSNLLCALAPTFHLLLVSRAFAGLSGGVLNSIIMAIVSDVIPIERRGTATGVIITAFSMAAVAGVPAGIVLGAWINWSATFYLLALLSLTIWIPGYWLAPSLRAHLAKQTVPFRLVIPNLYALVREPRNFGAYTLTFIMTVSHMLVIPFISPILVANHGIAPQQIAWIYMAGGAATFFTARRVGALSDRLGKHLVFRCVAFFSMIPILFITHLPDLPLLAMIVFFPVFMVAVSGRMIPMQALITTVPPSNQRGAFLSVNSAIQSLGSGCGAWLGGLLLSSSGSGQIIGYGTNGWLAVGILTVAIFWIGQVHARQVVVT